MDQVQVPRVDGGIEHIAHDEHGILAVDRIGEQDDRAGHAQIPERDRDDAAALAFAGEPLQQPADEKQALTGEAAFR